MVVVILSIPKKSNESHQHEDPGNLGRASRRCRAEINELGPGGGQQGVASRDIAMGG